MKRHKCRIILTLSIAFLVLFTYNKNVSRTTYVDKTAKLTGLAQGRTPEGTTDVTYQMSSKLHYRGTSKISIPKTFDHDKDKTQVRTEHDLDQNIARKFEQIAETHFWGGGNETISGPGSRMDSTITLRKCLGNWIIKYNLTSIVDIPCGDANWQHAIPGIENVYYRGYDVSKLAIDRARRKNPKWAFDLLDVTRTIPPTADLVIMRDFIQHLPLNKGKQALTNVFKSKSSWLGVSTYPNTWINRNITIGDYYLNNVLKAPFNLPQPEEICDNNSRGQASSHSDEKFYLIKLQQMTGYTA